MTEVDTAGTDRESARAFYDTVAASYAAMLPDTSFEAPLDLAVLDHFVASLPPSPAPVLDAGCGAGRMLGYLTGRGVERVDGVDLSPAMIREARAAHPGVPLAVADLGALPFDDGAFRGVLSWYSIIHVSPDHSAAVLRELARVLAPGGALLLGFQAGAGERLVDGAYGHDVQVRAHLHSTQGVAEDLVALGLEILATVDRAPRPGERNAQGFVLARRP
ncbi:class I SAM-dependent methyltransferase [Sanguibacter sp. 25GB23B1]|uniref:class I SAM-dependent methyltransferase n=1 Tax=unclassified Sanguibacter TaxID=2645534 RepID=UPI0032AF57BF